MPEADGAVEEERKFNDTRQLTSDIQCQHSKKIGHTETYGQTKLKDGHNQENYCEHTENGSNLQMDHSSIIHITDNVLV